MNKIYDYIISESSKWIIGLLLGLIAFTSNKVLSSYNSVHSELKLSLLKERDFAFNIPQYKKVQEVCDTINEKAKLRYFDLASGYNLYTVSPKTSKEIVDSIIHVTSLNKLICQGDIAELESQPIFKDKYQILNRRVEVLIEQLNAELEVWKNTSRVLELINDQTYFNTHKERYFNSYEDALTNLYKAITIKENASNAIAKSLFDYSTEIATDSKRENVISYVHSLILYLIILSILIFILILLINKSYIKFMENKESKT